MIPRIGLVARCNKSGLGYLCRSFDRAMQPAERIVITDCDRRYKDHIDWYGDHSTFVRWADMNVFPFERFLGEIDVLFSYEIFYHKKLLNTAKDMGVKTVLMGMPELTRRYGHDGFIGDPDVYVWPTNWRRHPAEMLLPVPVDPPQAHTEGGLFEGLCVLHVAGAKAIGDRNGTDLFVDSLRHIRSDVYVRICVNDRHVPVLTSVPDNVIVEIKRDAEHRWEMYQNMDVLCLPRRYGGLSLPVQEASAYGMAVLLPDCEPNRDYPAQVMRCRPGPMQRVPVGNVRTHITEPREIANMIDTLANNLDVLAAAKCNASEWAMAHSWGNLRSWYRKALAV